MCTLAFYRRRPPLGMCLRPRLFGYGGVFMIQFIIVGA